MLNDVLFTARSLQIYLGHWFFLFLSIKPASAGKVWRERKSLIMLLRNKIPFLIHRK